jgi:hypothetical protein
MAVPALARLLGNQDPVVRERAASVLIRLLDAEDPNIRQFTAQFLSRMGSVVVPALAGLLHDPDPVVRERAARALNVLNTTRLDIVFEAAHDGPVADRQQAAYSPRDCIDPALDRLLKGLPPLAKSSLRSCRSRRPASDRREQRLLSPSLAIGMAVVCFLLAAVFAFGQVGNQLLGVIICLFVGLMMLAIGMVGFWSPRPKRP